MKYILFMLAVWCVVNSFGVCTYAATTAEAVVTNGTCADKAGMCVKGSILTLDVTGINVSEIKNETFTLNSTNDINCNNININNETSQIICTIMIGTDKKVPVGLYDLKLEVNSTTNVNAGSILFGQLYSNDPLPKWTPSLSALKPYITTGRDMGSTLAINTTFNIFGVFNPSEKYSIVTFSYDSLNVSAHTAKLPVLDVQYVGDNYLTVNITGDASSFGMFGYVVKSTDHSDMYVPGVKESDTFAVYMPIRVSAVSGNCALNASMCINGEKLTFMSNTFNLHSPTYNVITIGTDKTTQNEIQCTVTAVTAENLTCTLSLSGNMYAGVYPMYIKTQVCPMDMVSPSKHFADLILGNFYGSSKKNGLQIANSTAAQYAVYDVMPHAIASSRTMKIHGSFDSHDAFDVCILPQMTAWTASFLDYPSCSVSSSNATTITCEYLEPSTSPSSALFAIWSVMVRSKNTNHVISWNTSSGSNSASFYATDSIKPHFTNAQGDCALDSTKCVNNSKLTLIGSGLTMVSVTQAEFLFPSTRNITCTPVKITNTEITCTLQLTGNVTGIWEMTYHVKIDNE